MRRVLVRVLVRVHVRVLVRMHVRVHIRAYAIRTRTSIFFHANVLAKTMFIIFLSSL